MSDSAGSSLDRLRPVFETALDAVVAMRIDGTVAEWNKVAEQTFGWSRDEAIGRPMADLIVPPQHRAAHSEGIARYHATGDGPILDQRLEITAIDREDREFPVELSVTVTGEGEGRIFIGFLRDISDRKGSEQLLVRQAREAAFLFQLSRFAAESESVEPVFKEALRAICELAGWAVGHALVANGAGPDELLSTDIWHGTADPGFERLREATQKIRFTPGVGLPGVILETREPVWMSDTETERVFIRKGLGYGAAFGFPLESSGRIIGVLEFFTHDRTPPDPELLLTVRTLGEQVGRAIERNASMVELRHLNETLEQRVIERTRDLERAQEALRQAQKMEAIGQLTGGIAHDFNNLLTVIRGSTDLLRRPELSAAKRRKYVDAISDTADRAARLTGQLLAFARRQALKPEAFDAAARIRGIADMLRTILGSRIRLVIDVDCDDCFVEADAGQFETSLVNLVVNARDAMDGEGTLTIAIRSDGDMVAVAISDSGHGIPPDRLDHIFEPFYTTKEVGKGTGLGLSQVYGFVKQSDGEIAVESRIGAGTTFTLSFPRTEAARIAAPADAVATACEPCGSRVLVVEDNADVGRFASQLLVELGHETSLVADGAEAFRRLEQRPDDFDIVFSDVVMPGMSGLELAKKVRERWPRLPVVLTSGYSHVLADDAHHGFPLLHKPYSADALARIIREAGSRASAG